MKIFIKILILLLCTNGLFSQTSGPDLVIDAVEITACSETSISYSATIKNVGDEESLLNNNQSTCSSNVSIQAYLRVNNDGSGSSGDKPAGGTVISCGQIILQPGESTVKSFTSTVSSGIDPSATPYLEIFLIPSRLTDFSDVNIDDNNSGFTNVPSKGTTTGPDLVIDAVEITACSETSISYSATIKNVGDEESLLNNNQSTCSSNVSIQAYLRVNNDGSGDNGDKPAGGTVISCGQIILQPGESTVRSFTSTVSSGIDPSATPYLEIFLIPSRLTDFSDVNIDDNNSGFTNVQSKEPLCNQLHEVEGAIRVENTNCEIEGSIRFTGQDFEGYMNGQWHSLTSSPSNLTASSGTTKSNGLLEDQGSKE